MHSVCPPAASYCPGWHSLHPSAALASVYLPAAHGAQASARSAELKRPANGSAAQGGGGGKRGASTHSASAITLETMVTQCPIASSPHLEKLPLRCVSHQQCCNIAFPAFKLATHLARTACTLPVPLYLNTALQCNRCNAQSRALSQSHLPDARCRCRPGMPRTWCSRTTALYQRP